MRQRPLLIWAAAFAAGIGLEALGRLPVEAALTLTVLGIVCLLSARRPWFLPIALVLLGTGAGALRLAAFQTVSALDIAHEADTPVPITVTGTITDDPVRRRGGRVTFFLAAEQSETRGTVKSATGEVSVTVGPEAAKSLTLDYGDRVRLEGTLETPLPATNPGAFSWRDYLARRGIYAELRVKRPGGVAVLGASRRNPWLTLAWMVRQRVLAALQSSLPSAQAAVLSGILIGRRTDLAPDLLAAFVQTGTVHILASAGLHVGILLFWLERGLQTLTLPRKCQAGLIIGLVVLYALVCGGRPAVVRAALMAALYYGAILFEREPDGPTAIGAAGLLILMVQPTALLEPGFQLSFLTILTLMGTMPVWDSFWRPRLTRRVPWLPLRAALLWAAEMAGLSLLAQLGALPIVAASYNEVSVSGWLANLIVVPLLFVLVPVSFAGILLGCLWHFGGLLLLSVAGWGAERLAAIVRLYAGPAWASLAIETPPLPLIVTFYALVYGGADVIRRHTQQFTQRQFPPPPAAPGAPAASGGAAPLVGAGPPP